uniref:Retrotransposon gag domain-containing protein n=1 Tax=Peronospora matthiolae TaxID=2874970 RepID=A0AAV1UWB4_9STRA
MSAITEMKEFSGREKKEERARNWISKVKSALLRDQVPEVEKCLVLSDLLTVLALDWYNQLSRLTRTSWKALLEGLVAKYGGKNSVSVGRLFYHARKRSNEKPLEYFYRLNVAAIQAKIPMRNGSPATRKEHVNH